MADIGKVLEERGSRYGEFKNHAQIAQGLKHEMHVSPGWNRLDQDMKEALEMVQHKIARILNGDPQYLDNWVDGAGYFKLVADRLEKSQEEPERDDSGDGWIEWNGGECPIARGTLIDVRHRDGEEFLGVAALMDIPCRDWEYDWSCGDIIAYRLSPSNG